MRASSLLYVLCLLIPCTVFSVTPSPVSEPDMQIMSAAFSDGTTIPSRYTCAGNNINPSFTFEHIPDKAQTLVLFMYDPDVRAGAWVHWMVWNIPATIHSVDEGLAPKGSTIGMNSFGNLGYGGPCPPRGETHHYIFALYALDTELNLEDTITEKQLFEAMKTHVLSAAHLVGIFHRARTPDLQ